ncbi:hypothetical protein [Nocardia transvalensis]|uniref:hypothetical protein n=1 Tax=Nocardia transvalensis TaxID=37333 RepID=UPI00189336D2|nr:hypothetical protein [Nocardia transvalensis]MBF6331966.1 hypothetical protein [Nocardia transvalensis]
MPRLTSARGYRTAMLALASVAVLTACSAHHGTTAHPTTDPDTSDCASGARVVGGLQSTFGDLTNQLGGIGPASERGDVADLQHRITTSADLAARITTQLDGVAAPMSSAAAKRAFTNVAQASDHLHTALLQLDQAVRGTGPAQGAVDGVQQSLNALNESVTTMRLSCSTVFAESTVTPKPRPTPTR